MFNCYTYKLATPAALMRWLLTGWIIPAGLLFVIPANAQGVNIPMITSPSSGQTLQGQVAITGTTDIPNFSSAELDFSYKTDATNTRFLIQVMADSVDGNILATWDTTSISDGDYVLQLRVYVTDGTFQDVSVPIHVRNYSALPSPTPTMVPTEPVIQIPTALLVSPSATPTSSPLPTPSPLPPNPAAANVKDIYAGFWRGGLVVLLVFFAFGITLRLRRS